MVQKHLSKREKFIFVICFLLAAAYAGYNFVFQPLQGSQLTLEDKIRVAQKRLHNNEKLMAQEKTVSGEYEKYAANFLQKSSDEQEMASILSQVESLANEIPLRVADMKPKKVKRTDFYNVFSASLTIEGDLAAIIRFLYTLQNTPYLFRADEAYFERSSVRTTQMRCRLVLSKILIP